MGQASGREYAHFVYAWPERFVRVQELPGKQPDPNSRNEQERRRDTYEKF
jgi:hypothetical protein